MQKTPVLNVDIRKEFTKGKNKELRKNGLIPGIISRKGMESVSVAVKKDELRKCLNEHGRNAIIKLNSSDGSEYNVIVKDYQTAPLIYDIIHIDFQQVSLSEEIKAQVLIKVVGQELLENKRLVLNRQTDTIIVSGLPQDIPDDIEIDVSELESGSTIKISDVKLPSGLTALGEPEQIILSITDAKVQETTEGEDEEEATETIE